MSTIAFTDKAPQDPQQQTSRVSLWIGMLLVVLFSGATTVDFRIDNSDRFTLDWQLFMRLAICAACGLYGLIHLPKTHRYFWRFPGLLCTIFLLWGLVTIPFAESKTYVVGTCFALFCILVFTPAVLDQLGGRRLIIAAITGLFAFVGWSWFAYFFVPKLGRYPFALPSGEIIYRVGGNSNELGLQSVWIIGLLGVLIQSGCLKWRTALIPAAIAAVTLVATDSKTAMVACLAVVAVLFLRRQKVIHRTFIGLSAVTFAALGMLLLSLGVVNVNGHSVLEKISRSGDVEELYSFTGRVDIWEFAIYRVNESPIVGYGYGSSRQALIHSGGVTPYEDFELHHAHNLLINVAVCTGYVGGVIVLAMLLNLLYRMIRQPSTFTDVATVLVIVGGIAEPVLFGPMPRVHTLLWLAALFWTQCHATLTDSDEVTSDPDVHGTPPEDVNPTSRRSSRQITLNRGTV